MKILCLDSTAKVATAAVLSDTEVLAEYTVNGGDRSHSELLLPMVRSLLTSVGMTPDDIDLFACTAGPGSFTGVRIGVSVIKGIAFGRGKPCCGVSSLEALAEQVAPLPALVAPVMDARRGQVYNALFRVENGTLRRLTPDRAIAAADLARELRENYPGENVALVGDGIAVAEPALAEAGVTIIPLPYPLRLQSAAAAGKVAYRMAASGETVTDDGLRPVYLRMPQDRKSVV